MKAIILCGGGGTRLWPESTPDMPKQFLRLVSGRSLLADTVLRLLPVMRPEDIVLVTGARYEAAAKAELSEIGCEKAHVVCEPVARNTAPAIALGVAYIQDVIGAAVDETIFVAPSDHVIMNHKEFYHCLREGEKLATVGCFVTFGIVPDYPETGYGYIETGEENGSGFHVKSFKEKPSRQVAAQYVADGNYYWNSGMFMFGSAFFAEQLGKYAPDVAAGFMQGYRDALGNFAGMPKISIDYAVAERTDRAVVVPFAAGWNDVGSWDAVYDISPKDENDNVMAGNVKMVECERVMVRSGRRKVAVAGTSDIIVVETADAVLVLGRGKGQMVRDLQ